MYQIVGMNAGNDAVTLIFTGIRSGIILFSSKMWESLLAIDIFVLAAYFAIKSFIYKEGGRAPLSPPTSPCES